MVDEVTNPGVAAPPAQAASMTLQQAAIPTTIASILAIIAGVGVGFVSTDDFDKVDDEVQVLVRQVDRLTDTVGDLEEDVRTAQQARGELAIQLGEIDRKMWIVCRSVADGCAP